jgi:hypothetical protein
MRSSLHQQLLYTTLQKEAFAAEDQRPNNTAFGVGTEDDVSSVEDEDLDFFDDNSLAPSVFLLLFLPRLLASKSFLR